MTLLAAVPLVAAACGTPGKNASGSTNGTRPQLVAPIPSSTTTTTKPPPPTTTTTTKPPPPTTTTLPPTTTTTQVLGPSGCPLSPLSDTPLPAGSFDVTVASVNLDGSHPNDQVIVYAIPSPGGAPFRMRAVLTTGYTVETDLSTVAPATAADAANQTAPAAQVLGGFDAAGTGKQMVFVQLNRVGSTDNDAAYAFSGCGLVPITNASSQVMTLAVGGDTSGYYAFGCGRDSNNVPFVETLSAVSLDQGADYNLTTTVYNFTGNSLGQTQQQSTTYTPPSGQTGPPPQMSTLACGAFGSFAAAGTTATTTTTTPGATTTSTSAGATTTTAAPTTTTAG